AWLGKLGGTGVHCSASSPGTQRLTRAPHQARLRASRSERRKRRHMQYRTGDWVQIKSAKEILATLDARGEVDGMPFMPEMLRFGGLRMRVGAVAHKTC